MDYFKTKAIVVFFLLFVAISIVSFLGLISFFEAKNDEVVARTTVTRRIKYMNTYIAGELKDRKSVEKITEKIINIYREYGFVRTRSHVNDNHNCIILESKIIKTRHLSYKFMIFLLTESGFARNYFILLQNETDETITIPDEKIIGIELRLGNNENISIPLR